MFSIKILVLSKTFTITQVYFIRSNLAFFGGQIVQTASVNYKKNLGLFVCNKAVYVYFLLSHFYQLFIGVISFKICLAITNVFLIDKFKQFELVCSLTNARYFSCKNPSIKMYYKRFMCLVARDTTHKRTFFVSLGKRTYYRGSYAQYNIVIAI